jgi:hypothetical protein
MVLIEGFLLNVLYLFNINCLRQIGGLYCISLSLDRLEVFEDCLDGVDHPWILGVCDLRDTLHP